MTRLRSTLASLQDASDMFQSSAPSVVKAMEDEGNRVGRAADAVHTNVNQVAGAVHVVLGDLRSAAMAVEEAANKHRDAMAAIQAIAEAVLLGTALWLLADSIPDIVRSVKRLAAR